MENQEKKEKYFLVYLFLVRKKNSLNVFHARSRECSHTGVETERDILAATANNVRHVRMIFLTLSKFSFFHTFFHFVAYQNFIWHMSGVPSDFEITGLALFILFFRNKIAIGYHLSDLATGWWNIKFTLLRANESNGRFQKKWNK